MMNIDVSKKSDTELSLKAAILLYGDHNRTGYASHHEIVQRNGVNVIGPGTACDAEVLTQAVKDLARTTVSDCFIDPNILAVQDGLIAWWRPPQKTRVWFHSLELQETMGQGGKLKTFSREVPLPGFVFVVWERQFYVFAVKGNQRPARETMLFRAPLMNVGQSGGICVGSAVLPDEASSASTPLWEKGFFRSRFTHFNYEEMVDYPAEQMAFMADLANGKFEAFPENVLVPQGCELMEKIDDLTDD